MATVGGEAREPDLLVNYYCCRIVDRFVFYLFKHYYSLAVLFIIYLIAIVVDTVCLLMFINSPYFTITISLSDSLVSIAINHPK